MYLYAVGESWKARRLLLVCRRCEENYLQAISSHLIVPACWRFMYVLNSCISKGLASSRTVEVRTKFCPDQTLGVLYPEHDTQCAHDHVFSLPLYPPSSTTHTREREGGKVSANKTNNRSDVIARDVPWMRGLRWKMKSWLTRLRHRVARVDCSRRSVLLVLVAASGWVRRLLPASSEHVPFNTVPQSSPRFRLQLER